MKFSYAELARLVPGIPPIAECADRLTMRLFEVESAADGILDLKILPNRYSDAACYWGIARELGAICDLPWKEPKAGKIPQKSKKSVPARIMIPTLCRRIMTVPAENIVIGKSPAWLVEALAAHGMRSINNLVDITNWVTLETGQPLHAFDTGKMAGGEIIVRQAHEGEVVETLGGETYALDPKSLVLADAAHALDIAGIKGGKKAEVTATTKNAVLVAGTFDGTVIYKTSRRIGLATDASSRNAHHLHPALAERGLRRAMELVLDLCGGTLGKITDGYPKPETPASITFEAKRFETLTGRTASEAECLKILKSLGFGIKGKKVTPPGERTDIALFEDCAEEVSRIMGYEYLPETPPTFAVAPIETEERILLADRMREIGVALGLTEIKCHSFAAEGEVALENPLNPEQGWLRASLVPGIRSTIERNLRHMDELALFEIGRTFRKKATHEPAEETKAAIVCAARGAEPETVFRRVRGFAETMLAELGIAGCTYREEGRGLAIMTGGDELGRISSVAAGCAAAIAEFDMEKIRARADRGRMFRALPRFPKVMRDVSLMVDTSAKVGPMLEVLRQAPAENLSGLAFVVAYEGKGVPEGKKSVTFRMTYCAPDRTLTDAEADAATKGILAEAARKFTFEIR